MEWVLFILQLKYYFVKIFFIALLCIYNSNPDTKAKFNYVYHFFLKSNLKLKEITSKQNLTTLPLRDLFQRQAVIKTFTKDRQSFTNHRTNSTQYLPSSVQIAFYQVDYSHALI